MAELKIVFNDPKAKKTYSKVLEENPLIGRRVQETIEGSVVGFEGYEFLITGGADNTGTAMRADAPGMGKKKILLTQGTGLRKNVRGRKVRKTVAGNTVYEKTSMLNLKVTKYGKVALEETLGKKEEAKAA